MKMTTTTKSIISGLLLLLPILAQANVGRVLYAAGTVKVERTESIALKKGDILEEGDIVVTGNRSRVQLLMIDGGRISIRANSRLAIETY